MRKLSITLGLRNRFFLVAICIQAVVLAALVFNSARLVDQTIEKEAQGNAQKSAELLAAAITAPMLERDLATLRDVSSLMEKEPNFHSLVVRDEAGQALVNIGPGKNETNLLVASKVPVKVGAHVYGWVEYEYSTGFVDGVRSSLIHQTLGIGLLALLGTGLLLFFSGYWISRHFQTLSQTAKRIADGDLRARAPVWGQDEVGQIAQVFNQLAESVENNVKRAKDDEARFLAIADYTYDLELWLSPEGRLLWVNPSV